MVSRFRKVWDSLDSNSRRALIVLAVPNFPNKFLNSASKKNWKELRDSGTPINSSLEIEMVKQGLV